MFEIRCIVPDKRLGETLRALEPFTLEPPVVQPGKEPNAKKNGNGHSLIDMPHGVAVTPAVIVKAVVAKGSGTQFTAAELRDACKAAGRNQYGYSYLLDRLLKKKSVKRIAPNTYEVV